MKSFNDLWIKSNSFCHLREQSIESPFPRCPVMGSWQLFPRHLDTIHHLCKHGIVAHQIEPHCLFFHPSRCVLCLNSRCFNISFRELIVSCVILEEIDFYRVSFCHHRVGQRSRRQRRQDQHPRERHLDREVCVSLCPSIFLPHDLNLGTRFLFSRGELSHP